MHVVWSTGLQVTASFSIGVGFGEQEMEQEQFWPASLVAHLTKCILRSQSMTCHVAAAPKETAKTGDQLNFHLLTKQL